MRTTTLSLLTTLVLAPIALAQITIYPGAPGIPKGTTRQMSAYVPLSPNTVTWAVNGTVGGSPTYGTVTPTGRYTAPAIIPPDNQITIKVTSTAQIAITQPLIYIWSAYPNTITPGAISLSINGSDFPQGHRQRTRLHCSARQAQSHQPRPRVHEERPRKPYRQILRRQPLAEPLLGRPAHQRKLGLRRHRHRQRQHRRHLVPERRHSLLRRTAQSALGNRHGHQRR